VGFLVYSATPVQVSGLTSGVSAVAAGYDHSLAIQNGAAMAWGYNGYGQLGNNTLSNSLIPVLVLDLAVNVVDVAAGDVSSYALTSDGILYVWGDNGDGRLGLGDTINRLTPTQLLPPAGYVFTDIAAGTGHAIATLAPIPEPTSLSLLGLAALGLRRRR
jgi:alpha-tubulin suppressor-like RCC1 family protein